MPTKEKQNVLNPSRRTVHVFSIVHVAMFDLVKWKYPGVIGNDLVVHDVVMQYNMDHVLYDSVLSYLAV